MIKYYDKKNRRLVYIGHSATPDFWDKHWDIENFKKTIESGKNNKFILKTLYNYIPDKKGKILEGGCGRGQVVYCMYTHGYSCVGIDFAKRTIELIRALIPELDVRVGDVRNLQFEDNSFIGYWSIGVIEHFWDDYHNILEEMHRVLVNNGYVFLTVPYMSPLRKLKAKLGKYKEFNGKYNNNFYQFALNSDNIINDFEEVGFELIMTKPLGGLKGFKDEISVFMPLLQKLFDYRGKNFIIKGFKFVFDNVFAIFAGHTMFFVFKNDKNI